MSSSSSRDRKHESRNGQRLEVAGNDIGSYQGMSESTDNYLRRNEWDLNENLGREGRGVEFSGESQGGVLVNHIAYLPAGRAGIPVVGHSREGDRGAIQGIEDEERGRDLFGGVAGGRERVIAGRYTAEEEIVELEQKVKVRGMHAQSHTFKWGICRSVGCC